MQILLAASLILFVIAALSVLLPVFVKGFAAFSSNLLFQDAATVEPGAELANGGILHAILGTVVIVILASVISIPLGILAALYVTEVRGRLTPYVRFFVQAMSGVPSIVAGLFVYAALIVTGILSFSGVSGAIALSILMLPTVARTAEEVLLLVPDDLRSAALALGATQRKVVRMVVLPSAGAGLVTASILGVARVTGETAPLLLTAFGSTAINTNPFSEPMSALPIYIFTQMLLGTDNDVARAWFACMVLMIMVGVLFGTARFLVSRRSLK
jgi:phosphate transport system permease protein